MKKILDELTKVDGGWSFTLLAKLPKNKMRITLASGAEKEVPQPKALENAVVGKEITIKEINGKLEYEAVMKVKEAGETKRTTPVGPLTSCDF